MNMTIGELAGIAITFIVVAFAISMGSNILADLQQNQCDYTWMAGATNSAAVNPLTSDYTGCCQTVGTGTLNCSTWYAGSYAMNTTVEGLDALDTMASWLPTLGLVVIAAVIIGVLIFYLGRRTGG